MGRGAIFTEGRNTTASTQRHTNNSTGPWRKEQNPGKRTNAPPQVEKRKRERRKAEVMWWIDCKSMREWELRGPCLSLLRCRLVRVTCSQAVGIRCCGSLEINLTRARQVRRLWWYCWGKAKAWWGWLGFISQDINHAVLVTSNPADAELSVKAVTSPGNGLKVPSTNHQVNFAFRVNSSSFTFRKSDR